MKAYNRENKPRRFLVTERQFGGPKNCCFGGTNAEGFSTCYGTPDDHLCRAACSRDYLATEQHIYFQTTNPYKGQVMCTGCALFHVLTGYASEDNNVRMRSTTLVVEYDLRNRTRRDSTSRPAVQPLALYEHRLRWLMNVKVHPQFKESHTIQKGLTNTANT